MKLLPWLLVSSFSSAVVGVIFSKSTKLVLPILVAASAMLPLGAGLLCTLSFNNGSFDVRAYGHEIFLGLGFGISIPTLMVACRMILDDEASDNAVMMGSLNMMRTMGGPIALAVCSAIGNVELPKRLEKTLPAEIVATLLKEPIQTMERLDASEAAVARVEYAEVYRSELAAVGGFAGLSFVCALLAMSMGARRKRIESRGAAGKADGTA